MGPDAQLNSRPTPPHVLHAFDQSKVYESLTNHLGTFTVDLIASLANPPVFGAKFVIKQTR
jgi:hypothetical protein